MTNKKCSACKDGIEAPFEFSMAFQPIVDIETETIFAYEALVRGPNDESAYSILSQVTEENMYSFDQSCRIKAIETAAKIGLLEKKALLSINFLPNAIYTPAACIRATLEVAEKTDFPLDRLIFEITETEKVKDTASLKNIVEEYKKQGFQTAIDDFGSGFAGLNLLSEFQPDIIKVDMELIRDIDKKDVNKILLGSIITVCQSLNITIIAEGIETVEEMTTLKNMGIKLHQGYLYAKPAFEALPDPVYPKSS